MFEVSNSFVQTCALKIVGFIVRFGDYIFKNNIFCMGASMEKSSCAFVVEELSLVIGYL